MSPAKIRRYPRRGNTRTRSSNSTTCTKYIRLATVRSSRDTSFSGLSGLCAGVAMFVRFSSTPP